MGRRAFRGGLGSNVGEGVVGEALSDCRRKLRCFARCAVWTGGNESRTPGMQMPQGRMGAYRGFRICENFPRLLLLLLELCSQRNLRSAKA